MGQDLQPGHETGEFRLPIVNGRRRRDNQEWSPNVVCLCQPSQERNRLNGLYRSGIRISEVARRAIPTHLAQPHLICQDAVDARLVKMS
jgi:hypothetical protein